jgi:aldose 1-epimerase
MLYNKGEGGEIMTITVKKLCTKIDENNILVFTLENSKGTKVKVMNYGGVILSIYTADKYGEISDIVLGYENIEDYFTSTTYFGAIIGRYANRIGGANISINDKTYNLAMNDGNNHLHGGIKGFDKVLWQGEILVDDNKEEYLELSYLSVDNEENYPGNLKVVVRYKLTDSNELVIDYYAKSDKDTVVNLTNHSYFNLSGHNSGNILNHKLQLFSDKFTPTDNESIPTGEIYDVKGTPMDFTELTTIGDRIEADYDQLLFAKGYDHNWILKDQCDELKKAAEVVDDNSGRVLQVYTTKPGIQFYTGNYLSEREIGKGGVPYCQRAGLCLETQYFPDSLKNPHFPNVILKADEEYRHTTIYKFSLIVEN